MLATVLKKLRQRKNITQAELANILGITQQAVARWERSKSEPDIDTLKQLSVYFDVSTDYLIGNKNHNPNFTEDEEKLLNGYRTLDSGKKQTLFSMLAFLASPQGASSCNVVLNNKNSNNVFSNVGNVTMT